MLLIGIVMLFFANVNAQVSNNAPANAAPVQLSVQDAINYALSNQADIKTAKIDELIQLAKNKEVSGLALPNISANGQFQDNPVIQKQLIDASNFDPSIPKGTLVPIAFGLKYNMAGQVVMNQTLFDPSVLVALQARKALEDMVKKNVTKTEVDVKSNVYQAYYSVLVTEKAVNIFTENIARLEKSLYETEQFYKNGLVEKLDVDRLRVQLTNLKTQVIGLQNTLVVNRAMLNFSIGMPIYNPVVLTDTLSMQAVKAQVEDTSNFNYQARPDYAYLESTKSVLEYDLKRYKLKGLPTLSLNVAGGASRASNNFDYFQSQMWYGYMYYGVNLNVPIFTGFQRKRQVDQAALAIEKTDVNMEKLRLAIDLEQTQAGSTFASNVKALNAQEDNMQLATDVYETTITKYREGVGSSTEMITAETGLLTAQNNYFDALYKAIVAKIAYLKAYGKL
ncbi:outer membrane protein TolC [Chitinophaga skermanii]|uniref:Outer membrane protein TolC n=2 Tax=Chitinophaga skermanii TaxID=331697 RepID=A0A327R485_9BACT|nr:outer membrane protein TolC [Chitinophaga skermanii]